MQAPAVQVIPVGQRLSHLPQLFTSFETFTQFVPPHRVLGAAQAAGAAQAPAVQTWPAAQAIPHAEQLFGSVVTFTHSPPQVM